METWVDVAGFEGLYKVSNEGRVKNTRTDLILKASYSYNGYPRVKLYKKTEGHRYSKVFPIHRLVARAFVKNTHDKPQVNHIDGDKGNNRAENLEWCTQSENLSHSVRIGLRDMTCCTSVTKKKVCQYDLNGVLLKVWDSLSEAARANGLQVANISHCCAGRIRQTGGYRWNLER